MKTLIIKTDEEEYEIQGEWELSPTPNAKVISRKENQRLNQVTELQGYKIIGKTDEDLSRIPAAIEKLEDFVLISKGV